MIIYTTKGCPKCKVLKSLLQRSNFRFTEIEDSDLMLEKGFTEAPMLDVDGKYLNFVSALNYIKGVKDGH